MFSDLHQTGVWDRVDRLGLAQESCNVLFLLRVLRLEHLDGDTPMDVRIEALVDPAHSAGTEELDDLKAADLFRKLLHGRRV